MQRFYDRVGVWLLSVLLIINTFGAKYMLWRIPEEQCQFFVDSLRFDFYQYFRAVVLAVVVLLLALLMISRYLRGWRRSWNRKDLFIGAYVLAVLLSYALSPYPATAGEGFVETFEGISTLLSYAALAWLSAEVLRPGVSLKPIFIAVSVSVLSVTAISLLQLIGNDPINWPIIQAYAATTMTPYMSPDFRYGRVAHGLFSNPNYLSSFYALFLPLLYTPLSKARTPLRRIGYTFVIIFAHAALLASGSLTGTLLIILCPILIGLYDQEASDKTIMLYRHISVVLPLSYFSAVNFGSGFARECLFALALYGLYWLTAAYLRQKWVFLLGGLALLIVGAVLIMQHPVQEPGELTAFSTVGNKVALTIDQITYTINFQDDLILTSGDMNGPIRLSAYIATKTSDSSLPFWLEKVPLAGHSVYKIMPYEIRVETLPEAVVYLNSGFRAVTPEPSAMVGPVAWGSIGSSRLHIWQKTLPLIVRNPIWGSGPDTFALVYPQNDVINNVRFFGNAHILVTKAHSNYLNMAANIGLLGLFCYLALQVEVVSGLLKHRQQIPYGTELAIGLILFAVISFANDSRVFISVYQWMMIGYAMAWIYEKKHEVSV